MSNSSERVVGWGDGGLILILSSPSGAGKSTLAARLLECFPELRFSVSHTTRAPRAGEVGGSDYHFVDRGEFESMVAVDAFAEWAEVHGNRYGTSVREIEKSLGGGGVLLDVDCQGARQIKARYPGAVAVFIMPPSLDELERRLRRRGTDSDATISRRLGAAVGEIGRYGIFDYVLVNDRFEEAASQLCGIVMAERCRRIRCARMVERYLREASCWGHVAGTV